MSVMHTCPASSAFHFRHSIHFENAPPPAFLSISNHPPPACLPSHIPSFILQLLPRPPRDAAALDNKVHEGVDLPPDLFRVHEAVDEARREGRHALGRAEQRPEQCACVRLCVAVR